MLIYIYKNNTLIAGVPAPNLEEFNANPTKFYPPMPEGLFVASTTYYTHPIIEGNTVRNKTREERILLDNELTLLLEGEVVENNSIVTIPKPIDLLKPKWESPIWVESITLEDAKETKRLELKLYRDTEIYAPYYYNSNSHTYDADFDSRNKLFQAQQLGIGASNSIQWITYDNQISLLNSQDLSNIVTGIATREQELFAKFSNKYSSVLNCETVDEVKKITW